MELVKSVKDVTLMCKEAGVNLTATFCDQGSTNYTCINELKWETRRFISRMDDETRQQMGFEKGLNLKDKYHEAIFYH